MWKVPALKQNAVPFGFESTAAWMSRFGRSLKASAGQWMPRLGPERIGALVEG
jgi:hypothetical protein